MICLQLFHQKEMLSPTIIQDLFLINLLYYQWVLKQLLKAHRGLLEESFMQRIILLLLQLIFILLSLNLLLKEGEILTNRTKKSCKGEGTWGSKPKKGRDLSRELIKLGTGTQINCPDCGLLKQRAEAWLSIEYIILRRKSLPLILRFSEHLYSK